MKEEQKPEKEPKIQNFQVSLKQLEDTRRALINMLEDFEDARKRAESERSRTESIIESFSDGILLLEENNEISFINPQAELFFDINNEAVSGKKIDDLLKIDVFSKLKEILGDQKQKVFRKELKIGENFVLEVSTILIKDKEEDRTLVVFHDVTREKMVERMKTEFVSVAAHQLRTPLSAIKWTLKMLLEGDVGELNTEQKEFLNKTYISNERMIGLINDLLNVTRIEEGRYLYKPGTVDFMKEVIYVIDSYKDIISKRGVKVSVVKPKEKLPNMLLDVEKIRLSIQNLLDNAIKYTPSGKSIKITVSKKDNDVIFEITDKGIGIPKEQQKRLFSKFFRGENAVKQETEGSGLGLFIARNIIEAHKGKIWFESKKEGTSFFFSLPLPEKE
jgi:two-component system phosphate regulon sensor histidine kinase PhoR